MAKKKQEKAKQAKKEVVAIASGDWHFHDWKNYNEGKRRIKDDVTLFSMLDKICTKYNVPLLFTGDMFHNPKAIPSWVMHYMFPVMDKALNRRTIPPFNIYGIDGNHDQPEKNGFKDRSPGMVEAMSKILQNLHCVNYISKDLGDFVLHGIPYITRNKGFEKWVRNIKLSKDKPNILMIHTDLPGAKDTNQRVVGTAQGIPERLSELFSQFDLVISGHIHKPQIMDYNVVMVGAPKHQRKTDIGCKMGYWKIYDDMSYEFVPLTCFPEFKIVDEIPEDDDHFYVLEKKSTKKLKEVGRENKRDFDALMNRKKLVNNYMKATDQFSDKKKRRKLKDLLTNA